MSTLPHDTTPVPPGEGLRRAVLCLVYLSAVAVAVVFSPSAGLWHLQPVPARFAAIQP